jgi:hypothetical protein
MKKTLLFLAILFSIGQAHAQKSSVWHKVSSISASKIARIQQNDNTDGENYFSIDLNSFKQNLANAKNKFSSLKGVLIEFPNQDGEMEKFQVWENSNMTPDFQAMFPQIRAYVGKGISSPGATINFSVSPQGIQTVLFKPDGETEFIEAYDKQATIYVVYNSKNRTKKIFNCNTPNEKLEADLLQTTALYSKSSAGSFKTMLLALSCTAEYANVFGSTTANPDPTPVIAAMNATMTRVNGVYEKDLSLHFNMINNTSIIYYDPATDPYSDAANMANWNSELQANLTAVIAEANYNIGHLFGASGGGGNAGCIGCVCSNGSKGSGITSPGSGLPQGDSFDIDYVAHEMGHQLGGNHTFTQASEGTIAQTEPGSGSTIMGYAGITNYDVQAHSDPIFSYKSIYQIQTNLNSKTCPVSTSLAGTNATPTANAGADYTIPVGTAFMLSGTASDVDSSDVLTYLWEQNDVGTAANASSQVVQTKTAGPNFRTFKPSTNKFRYFPQMGKILSGTLLVTAASNSNWESISSVARTLNFTFTTRDNHAGSGQTATDATIIKVNATGGAFSVSSQNTTGISYPGLSPQTVTWVKGSTDLSPFNSPTVDILLSTNVSTTLETFNATTPTSPNATVWTTIAAGVPNNGSYSVTLPDVTATKTTCRFMVKAVGNVFLAVNSKNFTITPSLATNEFGFTNFSIYPNPNKGNFNVKFDSTTSNDISIMVNDIRGRSIFEKQYSNTGLFDQNLQLSNLESGVYLVTVKDGDQKIVKRIVIE